MSETFFPMNDLLRRKYQTILVLASLTLSVASTLFLLLLGDKIGFRILSMSANRLTSSFTAIFSSFIIFVGILIFIAGAVAVSFLIFVMMSQRIKDIALMKAVGCPNDMVFGYFASELLIITLGGCLLGVLIGIGADFALTQYMNSIGFLFYQESTATLWTTLIIFVLFFVVSFGIGTKPVLDATKVETARALSPSYSLGLAKESDFKGISKAGLTTKIAVRYLFRRKSPTIRVLICLTVVFMLVSVSVAGGIIANQTTKSWVERAVGQGTILVGHSDMVNEYQLLLSMFYETKPNPELDLNSEGYLLPDEMLNFLVSLAHVDVDPRLVLETQIREVKAVTFGQTTGETTYVGDDRKGATLIVGIEPGKTLSEWFTQGQLLTRRQALEIIVGDTVAEKMFSRALIQNATVFNVSCRVDGVCIDPINNGNVTYIALKTLQDMTGITKPNIALVRINSQVDYVSILEQLRAGVKAMDSEFMVLELNNTLDKGLGFLSYMWSTIMFLPFFSCCAAALCLIGYVLLTINEQRQEFGVLRAVGAKSMAIVKIIAFQNLLVLFSSYGVGVALGIIVTLMILIPDPLVSSYTIIETALWLFATLVVISISALYPAFRFAKKTVLEVLT